MNHINDNRRLTLPLIVAATLLGIGLGGFLDGILFHHLLQWHQMLSFRVPPVTLDAVSINSFWGGVLNLAMWIVSLTGLLLLWGLARRGDVVLCNRLFFGGLLFGWGLFNVVEGLFNHHLFDLHNVREDVLNPTAWNVGFLLLSLVPTIIGLLLILRGRRAATHPVGRLNEAHS